MPVQRFNAILLHDSLPVPGCTDWASYHFSYLHQFLKPPLGIDTEGLTKKIINAEMLTSCKEEKYIEIEARHICQPIAMETSGVFSSSARQLGHTINSSSSGEARETGFLFQRISVLFQHFNAVLLHDCLPALDCVDWGSYLFVSFFPNFSSQIHYRAGVKSFLASHKCLDGRLRSKLCW